MFISLFLMVFDEDQFAPVSVFPHKVSVTMFLFVFFIYSFDFTHSCLSLLI